jgi:hypothetical protein
MVAMRHYARCEQYKHLCVDEFFGMLYEIRIKCRHYTQFDSHEELITAMDQYMTKFGPVSCAYSSGSPYDKRLYISCDQLIGWLTLAGNEVCEVMQW